MEKIKKFLKILFFVVIFLWLTLLSVRPKIDEKIRQTQYEKYEGIRNKGEPFKEVEKRIKNEIKERGEKRENVINRMKEEFKERGVTKSN